MLDVWCKKNKVCFFFEMPQLKGLRVSRVGGEECEAGCGWPLAAGLSRLASDLICSDVEIWYV